MLMNVDALESISVEESSRLLVAFGRLLQQRLPPNTGVDQLKAEHYIATFCLGFFIERTPCVNTSPRFGTFYKYSSLFRTLFSILQILIGSFGLGFFVREDTVHENIVKIWEVLYSFLLLNKNSFVLQN